MDSDHLPSKGSLWKHYERRRKQTPVERVGVKEKLSVLPHESLKLMRAGPPIFHGLFL